MKKLAGVAVFVLFAVSLFAQRNCESYQYGKAMLAQYPSLAEKVATIESFTHRNNSTVTVNELPGAPVAQDIITIPVVVHIIYHFPEENISDERVLEQIDILNRDFRKMNSDTVNTPAGFATLAADTKIEFKLASADPKDRATKGILHQYSPIKQWQMDDKVKFSSEMGDDAWDATSYLNIWVCNLDEILGYASFPGTPADRDGVVINYKAFGAVNYFSQYNKGRTAVHEVGHWLNLRHIWGDADCGDDAVDDTPRQRSYTPGCPSGIRVTCDNASLGGDMYMNYMDFTSDPCVNMFTYGQKQRMRSLFEPGGFRNSILYSGGLGVPAIEQAALPKDPPRWLHIRVYPNPVNNVVMLNFEYDTRWVGTTLTVTDIMGRVMIRTKVTRPLQQIDLSQLKQGIYFIRGDKGDEKMMEKIVKM